MAPMGPQVIRGAVAALPVGSGVPALAGAGSWVDAAGKPKPLESFRNTVSNGQS